MTQIVKNMFSPKTYAKKSPKVTSFDDGVATESESRPRVTSLNSMKNILTNKYLHFEIYQKNYIK